MTEHIDSIVANAELRADEIRKSGERDAEHARREAFDSASRVFERIQALERPLGELVHTLRSEMERVGRELEGEAYEEKPAISAEAESTSPLFEEPEVEEVEEPSPAEPAVAEPAAPEPAPRTEFSCASCQSTNLAVNLSEGVYRCADCGLGGVLPSVAAEVVNAELRADEIRQSGERDAEHARREAFDSASRVFERIQALERPLGELVHALRSEMERVGRELEGEAYEEMPAISAEAESALFEEPEVEEVEMPEWAREAVAAGGAEAEVPAEPAQPTMVSPLPQPAGEPQKKKKAKRRMFRRKSSIAKGAFIKTQGNCAVCQRTFMAGSEEAFKLSGWRANGEVGLCPDCQAERWQLPDGARLPFRRGGA